MMALAHVDVDDAETMGREKYSAVDRFNPLRIPIASAEVIMMMTLMITISRT